MNGLLYAFLTWLMNADDPPSPTCLQEWEARDGQEPTAESLRERARQIDARPPVVTVAKPPFSATAAALEKEFWATQL